MSTLTLVRHGQASFDSHHYDQLSALGQRQAQATGAYFKARGEAFTAVYSGPRERQRQTALAITGALALPEAVVTTALDEFGEGSTLLEAASARTGVSLIENASVSRKDKLRLYGEQIGLWAADAVRVDGIPPVAEFRAGIKAWLDELTAAPGRGHKVLAVTSAGVIAVVIAELMQRPSSELGTLMSVIGNASFTQLIWTQDARVLHSYNQTAHLPAELASAM